MKTCEICGKEFPTKWPKKYCLDCSKIVYKQQQDEWRAKRKNVSSEKKEIMKCERCWKEIKKKNSRQRYCIRCGNIVNREWTRDRAREKAKTRWMKKED